MDHGGFSLEGLEIVLYKRKVQINSTNSPKWYREMHPFYKSCKIFNFLKVLSIVVTCHFNFNFKHIQVMVY